MRQYNIEFTFFDGHVLNLQIEEDEIDTFLNDLGQNKPFMTKDKNKGFWLQGEQIRYFNILLQDELCQLNQN